MAKMRNAKRHEAWNRFADAGRAVLVGAATSLPLRPAANPARVGAGVCLIGIKVIAKGLKKAFPERRPNGEDKKSFPSEHAAECVASAIIIGREYPAEIGALAYGVAAAVSVARIEAKKHHPRDVAAGVVLGSVAVFASLQLRLALERRLISAV
jgi:membrane-associated phospholipid phosphatase